MGCAIFQCFAQIFNVFDLSVVQKLPLFYIKMMSINRGVARIFQRGRGGGGVTEATHRGSPSCISELSRIIAA